MTFTEAVSDGFRKYALFDGRSSRSAYWWWGLFSFIVAVVSLLVDYAVKTPGRRLEVGAAAATEVGAGGARA